MLLLLVALLGSLHPALAIKQVAIVGGGVSGAASAHFLRSTLGADVNITIFERAAELGGRTCSIRSGSHVWELGASIAWHGNQYVRQLADEAGLTLKERGDSGDDGGLFAIWDGSQFVFEESQWGLLTAFRLWWRYGFSYWMVRSKPAEMFTRFSALYPLQDSGVGFERPEKFLKALGLYDLTQASLFEYLRESFGDSSGIELFTSEVVGAVGRVNYNQRVGELNALAGLVSLLPSTDSRVFTIQGGNQQLARGLASKAGAGVLTGAPVAQITKETDGKFTVLVAPSTPPSSAGGSSCSEEPTADAGHAAVVVLPGEEVEQSAGELEPLTAPQRRLQQQQQQQDVEGWGAELAQQAEQGGGGGSGAAEAGALHAQQHGPFDAVILAAPLEGSGISLAGLDPPPRMPARKYRQTVTTLVEGTVRASYFGLTAMPFRSVMVTDAAETPFSSLSRVGHGKGGMPVHKLFSAVPLQHSQLAEIFHEGFSVLANKTWNAPGAYPRFDPPEDFAGFQLAEGLFYNNALETAASAMEIAAVAGRNTALLAKQYLAGG